jgi:hypothetical protein|tara:strand:+ start:585 stop:962 length:378 start_codon:yes stop_codon:yes gene_type:complete
MIKDNKQAQIDRMNEQLNDLLGPKPEEVKGSRGMFESMKVGDKIVISYKFEEFNMMKERSLTVSAYESIGKVQLSIRATDNMLGSMNIEKVTGTRLKAYSYDLMSQRTTYDFKFEDMSIIETGNE